MSYESEYRKVIKKLAWAAESTGKLSPDEVVQIASQTFSDIKYVSKFQEEASTINGLKKLNRDISRESGTEEIYWTPSYPGEMPPIDPLFPTASLLEASYDD